MAGCSDSPHDPRATAMRGYAGAAFVQAGYMPAIDWTLEPFDKMGEGAAVLIATTPNWTQIVRYTVRNGRYGFLQWIGFDFDDPTAYQRVAWRVNVNGAVRGGDENGLIPALEARAGILDGWMCPWPVFIPMNGYVALEALLTAPAGEETTVTARGRVKGITRGNDGGGVAG